MSGLSRPVLAAAFIVGFSLTAQAQSHSLRASTTEPYYGLVEGRSTAFDSRSTESAPVSPSESQTVMGLRVPR